MATSDEEPTIKDDSLQQAAADDGKATTSGAAKPADTADTIPEANRAGAQQSEASSDAEATERAQAKAKAAQAAPPAPGTGKLGENVEKVDNALRALAGNKKALIGIATGGGLIGIVLAIFLLLIPLKLEHMLKNLEDFRFKRQTYTYDRVSQKYLKQYAKARMELGANPSEAAETKYFSTRGGKDGPFANWYNRMRKLPFEDRLAKNQGLRFVGNGNGDAVILRVDGKDEKFTSQSEVDDIFATGEDSGGVGEHARARARIAVVVNKELPAYRIIKRHNMRLYLQASIGIKKWRFFEKTTDKANNFVRAYYVKGVLDPIHGKIGGNIDCLLKGTGCPKTNSTNDPDNNATGHPTGSLGDNNQDNSEKDAAARDEGQKKGEEVAKASEEVIQEMEQTSETEAEANAEKAVAKNVESRTSREFVPKNIYEALLGEKIGGKLAPGIGYIGLLDMMDQFRKLLKNNTIGKMVAVKNTLQYEGYFTAFAIATDNLKAGKDVNIGQVNAMMNKTNGYEKSAGYFALTHPNEKNPYPVDPDKKITNEGVDSLSNSYNAGIGATLNPILDQYDVVRHDTPILSDILDFLENVGGEVGGFIFKQFSVVVKDVTGFDSEDAAHDLLGKGATKMLAQVAGPVVDGTETKGPFYDGLDAGAGATSEQFMQSAGGHLLTPQQAAAIDAEADQRNRVLHGEQSSWTKVASLSEKDSVTSRLLMAAPLSTGEWSSAGANTVAAVSNPLNTIKHMVSSFSRSLSGVARASSPFDTFNNTNIWGVPPYGLTDEEIPDPTDPRLNNGTCDAEIQAYKEAMDSHDQDKMDHFKSIALPGKEGSPCTFYKTFMDASICSVDDNQECGGVDTTAIDPCQVSAGAAATGADVTAAAGGGAKSAYILGDSLTEGDYYENTGTGFLKDLLAKAHISGKVNASSGRAISIAGTDRDKTSGLQAVEDDSADIKNADTVVIGLGTNQDGSGSVEDYKKNVEKLVDKVHEINPDAKIYWVNLFSPKIPDKAGRNKALEEVSVDKKFTIIDANSKNISMANGAGDGIHPGPPGYKQLSKAIVDDISNGGGSADCGGTTDVSGNAQELADKIIKSGKLTGDPRYMGQIQAVAKGDNSCNVDPRILQMIWGVIQKGHSLEMSSLNRRCTGVLTASGEASYHYADGGGHAVDMTAFDGAPMTGRNPASLKYIEAAAEFLPEGAEIGQVACGPAPKVNKKFDYVDDTCNHVHIGVKPGGN